MKATFSTLVQLVIKKAAMGAMLVAAILFSNRVHAQRDDEDKRFSGGFGIETGVILGNEAFKNAYSSQFGISGRFALRAGPGWVTITPGATFVIPKNDADLDQDFYIHSFTKAGYKYIFPNKLFVMGEVGYAAYTNVYEDYYGDYNTNVSGGVCFAPAIGLNLGVFELGAKYEYTKLSGGAVSTAGLRFGFNF